MRSFHLVFLFWGSITCFSSPQAHLSITAAQGSTHGDVHKILFLELEERTFQDDTEVDPAECSRQKDDL